MSNQSVIRPSADRGQARALWEALRPAQWVKNVLVFAAPVAAGALFAGGTLWRTVVLFAGFCCAASGTYLWNDIHDLAADRAHPTKRSRPLAAGLLRVDLARIVGTALLVIAPVVALAAGRLAAVGILVGYQGLTLAYTFVLKDIAVVDLLIIAAGFVLRAAAGAVVAGVVMSGWFVLFIVFGSLFVVAGKRFAEVEALGAEVAVTRPHLVAVPAGYLRDLTVISCAGAIITYCVWALEVRTSAEAVPYLFEMTVFPVILAMFRYLLLLHRGEGSAPEELFWRDRVLQASGVLWVGLFIAAVQFS